jgi:hypothetical protein
VKGEKLMKKDLIIVLVLIFTSSIFGVAWAADLTTFSDVPANHWSYAAIQQLSKDGIIDGYGDGTFRGNKTITRYEMAMLVARAMTKMEKVSATDKALIEKLEIEYNNELEKIGALDKRVTTLESKADKALFYGMVRGNDDNQTINGKDVPNGNNDFYFNFEGTFKVNDTWTANFQSESYQSYQYIGNTSGASNPGTNVFERFWANGKVGDVNVNFGRKWDNSAYSKAEGLEATGVWLDYGRDLNTTLFYAKPSLTDNVNSWNIHMYGVRFADKVSPNTNVNLEIGGNDNGNGIGYNGDNIKSWGEIGFDSQISPLFKVIGAYTRTNANSYNSNREAWLIYRNADLNVPKSYDVYLRYDYLAPNGALTHDDEFSSVPTDTRGLGLGVDYIVGKNIEWTTIFFDDKFIAPQANWYSTGVNVKAGDTRKLLRTRVDFHF